MILVEWTSRSWTDTYSAAESSLRVTLLWRLVSCGGMFLVTFVVISIPGTCSKYFCMFTFRMFANKFLLSDAYNHSKQTLDFMQTTTTNKNCKEKETCIYLRGGVWPSSLCTRQVKSYAETTSSSSNYAST